MDNLLSGAIGGLIGTVISSIVAYLIFRRQSRIESNRVFLQNMISVLQRIFLSEQMGKKISDEDIDFLISFGAIGLSEFKEISKGLDDIRKTILSYNEGVQKTIASTTTSHLEITSKNDLTNRIEAVIMQIRKVT